MKDREIVEDLVVLLRGFFATPILSSLGRLGVLHQMRLESSFSVSSFEMIKNKKLLKDTFNYLTRLGLLNKDNNDNNFEITKLGAEVFRRVHSFYVPHSYENYLHNYHEMIQKGNGEISPMVDRLENVIGSGLTHMRYFPPAVSFLKRKIDFEVLIDIGCGDGHFLSAVNDQIPSKVLIGVDMSSISTERTKENLLKQDSNIDIKTLCCDGDDVESWSAQVPKDKDKKSVAISMWFFLQEISKSDPQKIITFLRKVQEHFPSSPVIIGEMVRQSEEILVKNNHRSLIPEYLFFHEMSNQGVLSWDEYEIIIEQTGYQISMQKLFDEVQDVSGKNIPSTFVWCLVPKEINI